MKTFDTRYKSPDMRARAARSSPDENPMEKPAEAAASSDEKTSGFAAVDVFGGQTPQVGQKFTIEIKDVDPNSREAEFVIVDETAPEQPAATPAPEAAESPMGEPS